MLLAKNMNDVFFILTDVLDDVGVGQQLERNRHTPGLCVGLRVVERELDLEVSEILPAEFLRRPHLIAPRMSAIVEPALVVEPERVDGEDVPVPLAEGIAEPGRRLLGGEVASV